jgi:hypothetical protein
VTAHFSARPTLVGGIQLTAGIGDPVSYSWTAHPNSDVSYRVYRKPKYGTPSLRASLPHGTTSYTDNFYERSPGGVLVYWDIRSYYNPGYIEAVEHWNAVFVDIMFKARTDGATGIPTEFSVGNHPNPFNPKTAIKFGLPVSSDVTISIYNMLGREIKQHQLLHSAAGHYSIEWDASGADGARVPSGVYLYRLVASPKDGSAPFVETRKMLLLK